MLKASPIEDAEEWAIHDYEGFGFSLSEYEGLENVCEYAEFIQKNGEIGKLLLSEYCGDLEHSKNILENYIGCYTSIADYAQEITEETTEIPKHLAFYINYEAMGRDMQLNGDIIAIEDGLSGNTLML